MDKKVLSIKGVSKSFPGVLALNNVSVDFHEGEVHALLGENGAGKSTLIKIIAGAIVPDRGKIEIDGQEFLHMTPGEAIKKGISVIYQEFNLVESLSAAENIYLNEKFGRFVDYGKMESNASELFKQFKLDMDPRVKIRELSPAKMQIVEIIKAISKNTRLLIMDEPTAPLSASEVEVLFDMIRQLKQRNISIIYISHRMDELFRISDKVTVMRDGCYIKTLRTSETSREELIKLMVGRDLNESYPGRRTQPGEIALTVENLTGNGVRNISFELKKGEILGIAGLVGSGRTELAMVIFGAARLEGGAVYINGRKAKISSPEDAIRNKIGLIPEDRKNFGCLQDAEVGFNITLEILKEISKLGLVNNKEDNQRSEKFARVLNIKTPSLKQRVRNLSGGNQQKVVLAKTLAAHSDILIFDEPTRGIDVGAKQEIYKLMNDLASEGKALLMISSDMEELLGMSDRVIVMCEGRLSGSLSKRDFSQERVLELASAAH
ncbi:MAG: sugar ABC transporter ATP-binding protein [Clostridiales bacterium]|nr:sugar ABC transporter ATP-binding protein [Clostridiales bacterium]